jgi:putative effector of murein hydrolase
MSLSLLLALPPVSIGFTLVAYLIGHRLHLRWHWIPSIVVAASLLICLLLALHEPFAVFNRGGGWVTWLLGPATVALAIPMFRNSLALRASLPRLAVVVFIGSMVGMASAGLTAWALGAPHEVVMSTLPKSVTTPIAIEVSKELGGVPAITIAMVILTGVLGASFGVPVIRVLGIGSARAIGAAVGTASHGVGTASLLRRSEREAAVASWAMAAAGIFTSLAAAVLKFFWK